MAKKIGIGCIVLGICCILGSVGFVIYNHFEETYAENASKSMLQNVQEKITESTEGTFSEPEKTIETAEEIPEEMATTVVEGYECIGILSIPVLELELPVLNDWSYTKLKTAPCLYFGTYYEKDFVIAAHNYQSHFGRLSELRQGDLVLFKDVSGTVYCYEVVLVETLPGDATEQMITSGFDLSLYTCTPSGTGRITVRCSAFSG